MNKKKRSINLDNMGLIIIGTGVSFFYYYFEKTIFSSPSLTILITVGIIILISLFTQLLINNINKSKEALREANETLELKVRERTAELRESEMKYRTIFENTGAATIIVENDMTISLANSEFVNISGFNKNEIENIKSWLHFIDEKSQRKIRSEEVVPDQFEPGQITPNFECKFMDKDNNQKDMLCTFATIPGADKSVVSLADISELKEAERQIYHQAFHDTLTSLPNRALFMEHLNMAVKRAKRRDDYHFAVLYLDIDRFKLVNDSLGHSVGDNLLGAFAKRIQESLRDVDILGRFGGDEFVILLEDIENSEYASGVADRLQQELKRPFMVEGKEVFAPASFGVKKTAKPNIRFSIKPYTKKHCTCCKEKRIYANPSIQMNLKIIISPLLICEHHPWWVLKRLYGGTTPSWASFIRVHLFPLLKRPGLSFLSPS
jgi:diguanylate cyclase (GGDEF)-like protein/PAS domain S-box-containing protein